MNIRVDLTTPITDGTEVVFRSPVDCSQVTGLIVYYNDDSKEFAFADAHGNNVGDIDHLFAENVVVKVILDVTNGMAFVQNADTNTYLEEQFAKCVKTVNGTAPDENGNVVLDISSGGGGGSSEGGSFCFTVTLEEDVSVVNLIFPVNWGRIIQFNIHADTMGKSLAGEMNFQTEVGASYNNLGTLSTNLKGIDFYGIRYMWDDTTTRFVIGVNSADNSSDLALPTIGVHLRPNPRNGKNNFSMISKTEGVMFPRGMRFDVWGVYGP